MLHVSSLHRIRRQLKPTYTITKSSFNSNDPTTDLNHMFKRWQHAHSLLMPMLSYYVDSAACLERAMLQPANQSDHSRLTRVLSHVDSSLSSLDQGTCQLQHAQSTLKQLRNHSVVLAPANRLPAELLTQIFAFATTCPYGIHSHQGTPSMFTISSLSSVCRYWREVAIGASSLWCHIDFSGSPDWNHPHLLCATKSLERSGSLPLQVHIEKWRDTLINNRRIIEVLTPHTNRIVSLHLRIKTCEAYRIVTGLFKDLPKSSVRELHMFDCSKPSTTAIEQNLFNAASSISGFLESLTTLHLVGPLPNPSSFAFHGLTELVLSPIDEFQWTDSDFRRASTSSPRLRLLVLSGLKLSADEDDMDGSSDTLLLPMVRLERLEALDLRGSGIDDTIAILSLIDTGSSALSLSLSSNIFEDELVNHLFELQPFIQRSRVVRFCLRSYYYKERFEALFSFLKETLPLVEELAFESRDPCDQYSYPIGPPSLRAEYFPRLHTLHFVSGFLEGPALQQALHASSVRELKVKELALFRLELAEEMWRGIEMTARVSYNLYESRVEGNPFHEWPISVWPII